MQEARPVTGGLCIFILMVRLEPFVEFASGAGDVDSAGNAALAVLYPLDDAGGLAALRAVGALGGVHYFLTVCGLRNLGHDGLSPHNFYLWALTHGGARRPDFALFYLCRILNRLIGSSGERKAGVMEMI